MSKYTIEVESDHPDVAEVLAAGANSIVEELGQDGLHPFKVVLLNEDGQPVTAWDSEG